MAGPLALGPMGTYEAPGRPIALAADSEKSGLADSEKSGPAASQKSGPAAFESQARQPQSLAQQEL